MAREIRVLVYEPGQPGMQRTIANDTITLHRLVGGYFEVALLHAQLPEILIVCNEDGHRLKLPHNRMGIVGTFLVARRERLEFASLTDEDVRVVHTLMSFVGG